MFEGWIVEPPPDVKAAAALVQEQLRSLEWLQLVPEHFLHVWLGIPDRLGTAPQRWPDLGRFEITYGGPNCFHNAVVLEVTAPIRQLVAGTKNDVPTFLPHLTVAVTRVEHEPRALRDILSALRGSVHEQQTVSEAKLVRFPSARSTLFQPWQVLETVGLSERAA
jgi:hypothetical protein